MSILDKLKKAKAAPVVEKIILTEPVFVDGNELASGFSEEKKEEYIEEYFKGPRRSAQMHDIVWDSWLTNKPKAGEFIPGDRVVTHDGRHGVIEANLSIMYSVEFPSGSVKCYFKKDKDLKLEKL